MCGFVFVILFCKALRGCEVFLTESTSLCKMIDKGRMYVDPHVVVPLMGRFKGETSKQNVLVMLTAISNYNYGN